MKRNAARSHAIRTSTGRRLLGGSACLVIAIMGTGAHAAASPSNGDSAANSGLQDIIVTARRQAESAQSTPVAVSAISAEQIKTLNIVRLDGISQLAPSVRISQASGSANAPAIFIRGIGNITTALYAEPSVGIYIDGVYTPRPTGDTFDLPDISSVEVLRGPQGTLFGRNTTGGAILLNTTAPTETRGAKFDLSYGSDREVVSSAVVQLGRILNTPFKIKLSAQTHSRDGWVDTPGHPRSEWGGALDTQSLGGAISGEIAPGLTIDDRARYSHIVSYTGFVPVGGSVNGLAYFGHGAVLGGPPFTPAGNDADHTTDLTYRDPRTDGRSRVKTWGDTFTAQYVASPAFTTKAIIGYSQIDELLHANLGGGYTLGAVANPQVPGVPVQQVSPHTTLANPGLQRQLTAELQANGKVGDFTYLAGFFYLRERTAETITTIIDSPLSATTAIDLRRSTQYGILSHSYAGFGQFGWKPSFADDKLEITGGVRYTKDKKELASFQTSNIAATIHQTAKNSWDNLGWSASASYKLMPSVLAYFRASSSYRSGGYNAPTPGAPPFDPEKAKSYEAGVKSDLFDKHVRLNANIYQTDYSNLQVNQFNQTTKSNTITNAGKARYRGAEFEGAVKFGGFSADGNVGYVDPKYQQYLFIVAGVPTNVASTAHFAFVSKLTWHIGAQYAFDAGDTGTFTVRADYSAKSNAYSYVVTANTPNFAQLPKLGKDHNLSARLIWNTDVGGQKVRASVFGENITNHRNVTFASDFSSIFAATYNRPRYYGGSLGFDF
ncbi:MAG: TonB-dependent receptor [Sphingomonas bacterium]|nr:TonB-dependent receptor [Sphingomonas bacterium]